MSKRVSWAPDVNLCQVRLFLSEDAPSQSGLGIQDLLQAKSSWLLHSTGIGSDDQPPPGFEGPRLMNPQIVVMKWKCAPRLVLNPDWQVVAGEESKEAEFQNQRQLRVLEAVYPRLSAIPPSPSDSPELDQSYHDDRHTPLIPMNPIEDDEMTDSLDPVVPIHGFENSESCLPKTMASVGLLATSEVELTQSKAPNAPLSHLNEKSAIGVIPGVEPDVVAAASAAFTAIMRSNEEGSLIDRDLLIKILSNPKLLEKLVLEYGMPVNQQITTKPNSIPIMSSASVPAHVSRMGSDATNPCAPSGLFFPVANTTLPNLNPTISNPRPVPAIVQVASTAPIKAPPIKDINYYKSLIQQHGGERNEVQDQTIMRFINRNNENPLCTNLEPIQSNKSRELKPKNQKPCIYFNSPSGCRNGANCTFQHDVSFQQRIASMPEAQGAKRIKLDRELAGRS